MLSTGAAAGVTNIEGVKRGWLSWTTQSAFPGLLRLNVGILPKEIRVVSEEENDNDDTMSEGEDEDD